MKAGKQHEPERQLAIGRVARFLARADARFRRPKAVLWKEAVSKPIAICTRTALGLLVTMPVREDDDAVTRLAEGIAPEDASELATAAAATDLVRRSVVDFGTKEWMGPSKVLRLGVGDCKNQATLLHAVLAARGLRSEVVVGLTDRGDDKRSVHAWVRATCEGAKYFLDPTVSASPMTEQGFGQTCGSYLDISPEYVLREPEHSEYGVGSSTVST